MTWREKFSYDNLIKDRGLYIMITGYAILFFGLYTGILLKPGPQQGILYLQITFVLVAGMAIGLSDYYSSRDYICSKILDEIEFVDEDHEPFEMGDYSAARGIGAEPVNSAA